MKGFVVMLIMALAAACERGDEKCIDESLVDEEAICTMQYDPVCGCDGTTYSNDCLAAKNGVLRYEKGECE